MSSKSKAHALTQKLELPAGITVVEPETRRPEPEPQEIEAVLYFERNSRGGLFAKHGQGLKGREGLVVFPHREASVSLRPGNGFVKFNMLPFYREAFAKPVTDKAKIQKVIDDLRLQTARLATVSEDATYLDHGQDVKPIPTILNFESQPNPNGKGTRLVARHGAGLSGGKGLVIFADDKSALQIKEGWNLVMVSIWTDRKQGLAQGCLEDGWLSDAIQDLNEQLVLAQ